jgi:hypothetical protein
MRNVLSVDNPDYFTVRVTTSNGEHTFAEEHYRDERCACDGAGELLTRLMRDRDIRNAHVIVVAVVDGKEV